jgi:hypothetical protein
MLAVFTATNFGCENLNILKIKQNLFTIVSEGKQLHASQMSLLNHSKYMDGCTKQMV